MKRRFIITLMCLTLIMPAAFCIATDLYPDTVALVNGSPIGSEALERKVKEAVAQLGARGQTADEEILRKEVLESLINNELIYQESTRAGYGANEIKIEMQVATIKGQFGTEDQFLDALEERGYTEDSLRDEIGRLIAIDDYISDEIAARITVTEDIMLRYYKENPKVFLEPETVRARHILVSVDDPPDERQKKEALRKIKVVKKKLVKGEEFESLAREFSDCPSSAQGGDLGFFMRGQMVQPFEDAAFALEKGEISDIVETRYGYHLIKLEDRRPEQTIPYENVNGDIEQYLGEQKVFEALKVLVEGLKEKATIERYL